MDVGKQRILITGASSGLGRELAHQFAQKGNVELILVARRKEALEKVAKKCSAFENVKTRVYSVENSYYLLLQISIFLLMVQDTVL